jgi:hypothetical protein
MVFALDTVSVSFKNQYLASPDMWLLTSQFHGICTSVGARLKLAGEHVEAVIEGLWGQERDVKAGYITADTKIVFRSHSANVHLLLQLSEEMWAFDPAGDLYFEKAADGYLRELWARWNAEGLTHAATVILFCRVVRVRLVPAAAVVAVIASLLAVDIAVLSGSRTATRSATI